MSSSLKQTARSPMAQGVLKGGIFFVTLTLAACLLRFADASGLFDASFLNDYVKDQGTVGVALFLGMAVVFSSIGMPRQLMSIAAGYAFGVFMGTLLMGLALVGGGLIGFYYVRFLARNAVQRRFAKKIAAIERVWLAKPFLLTVCLRLLPVGNNALLNLLAGTSRIHPLPFFCGSFVGYIPQNLIFTLLGSGIGFDDTEKFLYSGLLFLVSVGLGIAVYRSLQKQGTDVFLTDNDETEASDGVHEMPEPDTLGTGFGETGKLDETDIPPLADTPDAPQRAGRSPQGGLPGDLSGGLTEGRLGSLPGSLAISDGAEGFEAPGTPVQSVPPGGSHKSDGSQKSDGSHKSDG